MKTVSDHVRWIVLRAVACLMVAFHLGCTSFHPVDTRDGWSSLKTADRVLIHTRDGQEHEILVAAMTPASLSGRIVGARRSRTLRNTPGRRVPVRDGATEDVVIQRSDVLDIQIRQFSRGKTAVLVLAVVGGLSYVVDNVAFIPSTAP